MSVTGEPDGPPGKCGVSIIDFAGGYVGMVGLMVGLFDAQRTGIGRDVDIALLDTAVSMLSYFAIWTLNREWAPERTRDSAHQVLVPAQNFPTKDGWIVVFCNKDKFWQELVEALEAPEIGADPRFRTFPDRHAHRDVLLPLLKARFATRTTADWLDRLRGRVPVRARQRRAPGPGRRAGPGARHDRGGPAPGVRDAQGGAQPHPHRGRGAQSPARAEARRGHRRHPGRDPRLQRLHHRRAAGPGGARRAPRSAPTG